MQKSKKKISVRADLAETAVMGALVPGGAETGGAGGAVADVGKMVDSGQADDRRLIRLVRARRLLYARNNMPVASYYAQVKRLWEEVADEMDWTVADVRRKWSHIRNSYSRHLRNEMHGACTSKGRMVSKWYLADELDFLRDHMATDTRSAPYPTFASSFLDMDMSESQTSDPMDIKPLITNPWFSFNSAASASPSLKLPALASFEAKAASEDGSSSNFGPDENSSYFQFFRGIYSEYLELSPRKQRQFKRQCVSCLHGLLDEQDGGAGPAGLQPASAPASDDEREAKVFDNDNSLISN